MKASLSEGNQDKPLSPNIRAVELKKLTIDELLEISHLNRSEIEQRVLIAEEKFEEGAEVDKKSQEKLSKIKTKLERGKGIGDIDDLINKKYLTPELMLQLSTRLAKESYSTPEEKKNTKIKNQEYLPCRNSNSTNFSHLDFSNHLRIKKIDENQYSLKYKKGLENSENFAMTLQFKNNKCKILFESTFSKNKSYHPEEMQIAMLKKASELLPEIVEKLSLIQELDLERESIINSKTLDILSKFTDPNFAPTSEVNKIFFPSTPNGNNSMNFLNQLIKELLPNAHFVLEKTKVKSDLDENHNIVFKFKISQNPIESDLSSIPQPTSSKKILQPHSLVN